MTNYVYWKCKDYWSCCLIVQVRVVLRMAAILCCFDSCDWLAQVTIRVKWGVFIGWVFITWLLWYSSFKWKLWHRTKQMMKFSLCQFCYWTEVLRTRRESSWCSVLCLISKRIMIPSEVHAFIACVENYLIFSFFLYTETFDKKQVNSIFWSPNGQFCILAGLRK